MSVLEQFRNEPNHNQIMVWAKRFQWADKIKMQACNQYYLYRNNEVMDKRMEKIWAWVMEVEPLPTFINGVLNSKASGLLNIAKIYKAFKK